MHERNCHRAFADRRGDLLGAAVPHIARGNATRAQLTSMVARMLSTLVDEGHATAPA